MTTNIINKKKKHQNAITMKDFKQFLSAKSFKEQLIIITIHSQKNQENIKKGEKTMKNQEKKKIL